MHREYANSLVIRQMANLKTGVTQKESTPNFSKNKHFLPPDAHTCVRISEGKKCSFFGKFGMLRFLVRPVLRFAFLPYCRRVINNNHSQRH